MINFQANPHMIRMLEKEKQMLSSQLRDLEWRLDQESKVVLHKIFTFLQEQNSLYHNLFM